MISGKWEFKEEPSAIGKTNEGFEHGDSTGTGHVFSIDYLHDEVRYTSLFIEEHGSDITMMRLTNNGEREGIALYDGIEWYSDSRVMDFGTNPQIVSAVFYNWFTANATRID